MDGQWRKVGCAFRTELGIYTAKHVPDGKDFRLTTQASIVEVPYNVVQELDADAIVIPAQYCPAGVTIAKLAKGAIMGDDHVFVEITNGVQRSVGPLVASKSFGSVVYSGSTCGGFSGAPYHSGRTVFGMHTGAAAVNFGYEAGYLRVLTVRKEDSEDQYIRRLYRDGKLSYKISPFDPDDVFVRSGTGYISVERQRFEEVMLEMDMQRADHEAMEAAMGGGEGARGFRANLSRGQRRDYERGRGEAGLIEFDDQSGNVKMPAAVVLPSAGSSRNNPDNVANPSMPISTATPSTSQKVSPSKTTVPQRLTPAQKREVSVSMLQSTLQSILEGPPEERMIRVREIQSLASRLASQMLSQQ